jgi:hypothetical protein
MSQSKGDERREFQRLHLTTPLSGTFGGVPVTLVEAGVLGARLQHTGELPDHEELSFSYAGEEIRIRCDVIRTFEADSFRYPGGGSISGVRFRSAVGSSGDHLREMLAELVTRAIEERHDSSATKIRIRSVDGDRTVRGSDANFISYRFENGTWRKRHVFLPEQPAAGFTVARGEDAEEMHRLCEVFEVSDEEGRRLIRLFAELSISEALQIPPRK